MSEIGQVDILRFYPYIIFLFYVLSRGGLLVLIQLQDHFTYRRLLAFTLPTIFTLIITSVYSVVDAGFVSNLVGADAFAAVNLVMPFVMIIGSVGFLFGTGGSAVLSKLRGEQRNEQANGVFSLLVLVSIGLGILLTIAGNWALVPFLLISDADASLISLCEQYGRLYLAGIPFFILQYEFQSYLIVAERPRLSLWITSLAGLTNILLDYVFMALFHWGLYGAAGATVIGQAIGGLVALGYTRYSTTSRLRFGRPLAAWSAVVKTLSNGASELLNTVSSSLVSMLINIQLMACIGKAGVVAYGIMMYVDFMFNAIFFGYSIGMAPIIAYHYGARNVAEMKNVFIKSLVIIELAAVAITVVAELSAPLLAYLFVGYDESLTALTTHGFRLYAILFLTGGIPLFTSAFFTALSNGAVSACLSFMRTLVFQILCIIVLPMILGLNGIWLSMAVAEFVSAIMSFVLLYKYHRRYGYV